MTSEPTAEAVCAREGCGKPESDRQHHGGNSRGDFGMSIPYRANHPFKLEADAPSQTAQEMKTAGEQVQRLAANAFPPDAPSQSTEAAHDSSCACFTCHAEGRFEATCGEWCEHTPRDVDLAFHRYWRAQDASTLANPDDPDDDTPDDASLARVRMAQSAAISAVLAAEFPYREQSPPAARPAPPVEGPCETCSDTKRVPFVDAEQGAPPEAGATIPCPDCTPVETRRLHLAALALIERLDFGERPETGSDLVENLRRLAEEPPVEGPCASRDDGTHCEHWWDDTGPCCDCHDDTHDGTEEDHGERSAPPVEGALDPSRVSMFNQVLPEEQSDTLMQALHDRLCELVEATGGQDATGEDVDGTAEAIELLVAPLIAAARSGHDGLRIAELEEALRFYADHRMPDREVNVSVATDVPHSFKYIDHGDVARAALNARPEPPVEGAPRHRERTPKELRDLSLEVALLERGPRGKQPFTKGFKAGWWGGYNDGYYRAMDEREERAE